MTGGPGGAVAEGTAPLTIGISLKTYLGHREQVAWAERVAEVAAGHPAVRDRVAEVFVAPTFPALVPVATALVGSWVLLAAQDLGAAEGGPWTGEVTGAELAEVGATLVEVGHAERRRWFGEDETVVAVKTVAALRHGLRPVLCVGEDVRAEPARAAARVAAQVDSALAKMPEDLPAVGAAPLLVAYEPVWAIGAAEPAPAGHVREVVAALREHLDRRHGARATRVVYGGSARPGLLTGLNRPGPVVPELFLGRFAHDPTAVAAVLDEAHRVRTGKEAA